MINAFHCSSEADDVDDKQHSCKLNSECLSQLSLESIRKVLNNSVVDRSHGQVGLVYPDYVDFNCSEVSQAEELHEKITAADLDDMKAGKFSAGSMEILMESLRTGFFQGLHKQMDGINQELEVGKSDFRLCGFLDKSNDGKGLTLWLFLKKEGEQVRDLVMDLDKNLERSQYAERGISITIKAKLRPADAVPSGQSESSSGPNISIGSRSAKLLAAAPKEGSGIAGTEDVKKDGDKKTPFKSLIESDHESFQFLAREFRHQNEASNIARSSGTDRPLQLKDYSQSSFWLIDLYRDASKAVDETVRDITRPKK